jgi:hypothetical protein
VCAEASESEWELSETEDEDSDDDLGDMVDEDTDEEREEEPEVHEIGTEERKRRVILLALMTNVLANVPVERCAIVHAVRGAVQSGIDFSAAELGWIAFIKVPCAIHRLLKYFREHGHTHKDWKAALKKVCKHFKAHEPVRFMKDTYYTQFLFLTTRREKKVLPYIREVVCGMSSSEFDTACASFTPDWTSPNIDLLADQFVRTCHLKSYVNGSNYKPFHAMRSIQTAMGLATPMRTQSNAPLLPMSEVVIGMRTWFYPASVKTAEGAHMYLASEMERICTSLGVRAYPKHIQHALKIMSTGDEACLMCEGSHCSSFTDNDIEIMEQALCDGSYQTWRKKRTFTGRTHREWSITETKSKGIFVGPAQSMAALREMQQ